MSDVQSKSDNEQLNEHTRSIYHKQHVRQGEDEVTRKRLMSITTEEFFAVEPGFFEGKKILDAGCGSIARNAIAYYQMGSRDVTAMDLGNEWFDSARRNMARYEVPIEGIKLISGNATNLPFDAESFDFVSCDGVLTHLADTTQVTATIKELGRVTKPGGYLFTSYLGGGGLIETKMLDGAREFYKENKEFALLIDNIKPSIIHEMIDFAAQKAKEHGTEPFDTDYLKSLLDEDLCITFQNILQAQRREHHRSEFVNGLLKAEGFGAPKILKRYIHRKNIRKYIAPFHFYSDHPFSKLLYGDGWVDCISQKLS